MVKKSAVSVGILGYGEVGQAIAKFFKSAKVKDLERDDGLSGVGVLHVCVPWSNDFENIVRKAMKESGATLVIIHSSVPPGTTKKLGSKVVHSPVRGVHPNLYEGVKTFVKYIGADSKTTGLRAEKHMREAGMKTKLVMPSVATELGKLLDTSYYGLCIAWHGEMKKMCDAFRVDFDAVVTDFNKTYNEGYRALGKECVTRPILYPPEGGIGGHCVCENAALLRRHFQSMALDLVVSYHRAK